MGSRPFDSDDDWDGNDQLDLAENERLPWLESGEEDEGAGGFDTSRLVLLGVLAFLALAVVVGGIWYLGKSTSGEPEPDGSLIAAPTEPYKTRPKDQGGKVFAGTGDTSFAVGEGQSREGKLADTSPIDTKTAAAKPSIASTVGEEPRQTKPQPVSGGAVQVGAFPSREEAEAAWGRLIRQTEVLSGVSHRVVEARVDIGRVYRLQALAGDRAGANRLCDALKADGLACFVK
ncbi:SPOR domain-containing protein [Qipengyuania soli]|uniref:SPOR domain-containing protein n=1 Tax=Qipengyuania soli TaxID=2782568 RepID=A0A7S8F534_9SPHN|nr:SPOR domain-containing protein [Qipengyuania soli]QPC99354.1 SPOR domain-containing protein [Qipengyuania soli]